MRFLITAGPTREAIDSVRFITNASSGRMGYAVAQAALDAGHAVTLLAGPTCLAAPVGAQVVPFVAVDELKETLDAHFDTCDVLVMAAAVGDFRVASVAGASGLVEGDSMPKKLPRRGGPITLTLVATEDVVAGVAARKRPDQRVAVFAVEAGPRDVIEAKAQQERADKQADVSIVNTPAAMGADASEACILDASGVVLPWASRPKQALASQIVTILTR